MAESFFELCHALGITGKKNLMKEELSKAAHRSSFVIWLNRYNAIMFKSPVPICDIPTNLHFRTVPDSSCIVPFSPKDIFPPTTKKTLPPPQQWLWTPPQTFLIRIRAMLTLRDWSRL